MLTKATLRAMKEAELRATVLLPLLRAMGYHDVTETHGVAEQGKDIVCWKADDLGSRVNVALVVKAVPLSGKAAVAKGTASEVQTQIQQCFGSPFLDPLSGEERRVHRCWVVTNRDISKVAVEAIVSSLSAVGLARNVSFVSGDTLWGLVEQHLPTHAVWQKLTEAQQVFNGLDDRVRPEVRVSDSIAISWHEKFPGALDKEPVTGALRFEFPNTPEGRAKRAELEAHLSTGAPVDTPAPFVQLTQVPAPMQKLIGRDSIPLERVQISTAERAEPLVVHVELVNDAGDTFVLYHVELKLRQAGREEVTLTNDAQPSDARVTLKLRPEEQRANIHIALPQPPRNVYQSLSLLLFAQCRSLPFIVRLVDVRSGISRFEMRQEAAMATSPAPELIETMRDLVAVQAKTKREFALPNRSLTPQELETIERLSRIHRTGMVSGKWDSIAFDIDLDAASELLDKFANGKVFSLPFEGETAEELFGATLPLGPARTVLKEARLANEKAVRQRLTRAAAKDKTVTLRFISGEDSTFAQEYLDWGAHRDTADSAGTTSVPVTTNDD